MAEFIQAPPPPPVPSPRLQGEHYSVPLVPKPNFKTLIDLSCNIPRFPRSGSTSGPSSSTPRLLSSPAASSRRSRGDPSFTPSACLGERRFSSLAPGCCRKMGFCGARSGRVVRSWLLEPLRDSNLELFALVAVWIASKVRDTGSLSFELTLYAFMTRAVVPPCLLCAILPSDPRSEADVSEEPQSPG